MSHGPCRLYLERLKVAAGSMGVSLEEAADRMDEIIRVGDAIETADQKPPEPPAVIPKAPMVAGPKRPQ